MGCRLAMRHKRPTGSAFPDASIVNIVKHAAYPDAHACNLGCRITSQSPRQPYIDINVLKGSHFS